MIRPRTSSFSNLAKAPLTSSADNSDSSPAKVSTAALRTKANSSWRCSLSLTM